MSVDLHVEESGSGRPLVLLHAFPLDARMWAAQQDGLADVAHVLAPDQRGFGGSPLGDDPPSLDRAAEDVAALLDARGLSGVVLGGNSMGGYVVMACLRHPAVREKLAGLVLVDTRAGADPPAAAANRHRIAEAVLAEGSGILFEELPNLLGGTSRRERPDVVRRVRELAGAASPAAVAWAQRAMAARPDSLPTLRAADLPALVVVGEEDGVAPPEEAQAIAEAMPDARLVGVPRCGHLPALEAPEALDAAIRAFLAELR
ncbi:MAG TPA: alpha/beta fold hydrolase [Frankiaceae bacterium]|nr:alpha/beta fold hydrolase [Frankiaceae bacterium]